MASKQEIIAAIETGETRVSHTFGALSEAQLATPVHEGVGGWTVKGILAHLAARGATYDALIGMAGSDRLALGGGFDIDAWNQAQVDTRIGESRDALLSEFRAPHDALIVRVQAMPDEALQRTIVFPRGPITLGDVLRNAGGTHAVSHAEDVENALGMTVPSA